jgi:trans-2,3-dihydro-3-hydroxyanthranilate isomerase
VSAGGRAPGDRGRLGPQPRPLDARPIRPDAGAVARELRFVQVDVFTDQVFGGNPLAVVFEAAGLGDREMQAIAREMNLSETTFLLPPTRPECAARVRIFTPAREVPFAGHPTIGTAWVLAAHGLLPAGTRRLALEEGIGPVPVAFGDDGLVWMEHRDAAFRPEVRDRRAVAAALGLPEDDLLPGAPVQSVSTGNDFLFVALRDRAAVDRAQLNVAASIEDAGPTAALGVYAFTPDGSAGRIYARMFAPRSGVPEDPATGSAAGPLGAYLVRHRLLKAPDGAEAGVLIDQGVAMGRPSRLHLRLRVRGGEATDLRVGGRVVPIIEGRLRLPEGRVHPPDEPLHHP